jgi:hypothetical protein
VDVRELLVCARDRLGLVGWFVCGRVGRGGGRRHFYVWCKRVTMGFSL